MKIQVEVEVPKESVEAFDKWSQTAYGNVRVSIQECLEAAVINQILEWWEHGNEK